MLISPESTAIYLRAGQGYKLVIVIAGSRDKQCTLAAMTVSSLPFSIGFWSPLQHCKHYRATLW